MPSWYCVCTAKPIVYITPMNDSKWTICLQSHNFLTYLLFIIWVCVLKKVSLPQMNCAALWYFLLFFFRLDKTCLNVFQLHHGLSHGLYNKIPIKSGFFLIKYWHNQFHCWGILVRFLYIYWTEKYYICCVIGSFQTLFYLQLRNDAFFVLWSLSLPFFISFSFSFSFPVDFKNSNSFTHLVSFIYYFIWNHHLKLTMMDCSIFQKPNLNGKFCFSGNWNF